MIGVEGKEYIHLGNTIQEKEQDEVLNWIGCVTRRHMLPQY